MSQQSPRTRPPARKVSDQVPPPPAPKKRPPTDPRSNDKGYDKDRGYGRDYRDRGNDDRYGGRGVPPRRTGRGYYEAQPRRDMFPILMGGLVGALVVGLMVLVYLLVSNNNGNPSPGTISNPPSNPPATQVPGDTNDPAPPAAGDPPRMTVDEFKALYDDPATRPLILDVRAKEAFDEGHIAGAISFPEADVATRVSELPKDKMIVAYCQ